MTFVSKRSKDCRASLCWDMHFRSPSGRVCDRMRLADATQTWCRLDALLMVYKNTISIHTGWHRTSSFVVFVMHALQYDCIFRYME